MCSYTVVYFPLPWPFHSELPKALRHSIINEPPCIRSVATMGTLWQQWNLIPPPPPSFFSNQQLIFFPLLFAFENGGS